MRGAPVCRMHGGSARQVRAAAEGRLQREAAVKAMQTYGLPIDIDPRQALLDEIHWTAGHVQWLREMVQSVEPDALVWGKTEVVDKQSSEFPGEDTTTAARPNIWLQLYREERKHLVDACATAIRIGLEEEQVKLAQSQGSAIADLVRRLLEDPGLALTARQQEVGRVVAAQHLRVLSAAAV